MLGSIALLQLAVYVAVGALMGSLGYGWSHWQYWAVMACIWVTENNSMMYWKLKLQSAVRRLKEEDK